MKKIKYIVCIIFFLCQTISVSALVLQIHSENAILYNLDEGTILYEKNADEVISIASLTKIMTAIIAIENASNLDEKILLTYQDFSGLAEANASVAGFYIGEEVTLLDLLYGLLFPSGADAAQAITRIFGGREHFVELMNEKAKDLGLVNTYFVNETGLDAKGHHSTVTEVGKMFSYALSNETFKKIIETTEYTTSNGRKTFVSTIRKFMQRANLSMDYLIGGKTGTTSEAGLCLASIATFHGTNYMLVTARASNDWINPTHLFDAKTIYEYFMEHYETKVLLEQNTKILELKTKYANEENISYFLDQEIKKYVPVNYKKEDLIIEYNGVEEVTPKMKFQDKLGTLKIRYFDEVLYEQDILLNQTLSFNVWQFSKIHKKEITIVILLVFLSFIVILFFRKKKSR